MALSAKLQLRQSQSLVMTPQLLQSIRLLQYSQLELQAFIDAEIERNPLIAVDAAGESGPDTDWTGEAAEAAPGPAEAGETPLTGACDDAAAFDDAFEAVPDPARDAGLAARGEATGPLPSLPSGGPAFDGGIEDFGAGAPSLQEHALGEARDAITDPRDLFIAAAIVDELDEAGYARIDIAELAAALGAEEARVALVLARLQGEAEPAGLFARDLSECLALQLRRLGRYDPVIATVLDNLDLLARRDFATLRRLTGEDEAGLLEILAEIRGLDPRPGQAFASEGAEPVTPDVIVTEGPDGAWQVELNPEALPRVIVDNHYAETIAAGAVADHERAFIGECQQSANWLVRSLDQRARTILKVAGEIVRRQDGFLTRGIGALRPMTLMSVAEAVGMHESTISRVTANKFMATPRGTFEMRFFFTVAIASVSGGDAHSAESVKHRIRGLVDAEGPGKVLSDDDIAAALKREGVDLARRTVAKYREALGIASSIQRRREMNARRLAS
ncbi:RNA polymerase factor sigma-54 [Aurantimonas sp. Leaf443]|uniref:RNA polymerase factor sigma-54 n=1 Tax=Aurantimonas sp. Leaf443 TaxID=1736378 RepID=UPI0007014865|nr:RNA polymerase factor sigma-54 [Aurantimonas sp. Leaf443]KQT83959.1 RNA polymerase sigma-54 factor [Aurantimonas sp. Leaf443]